MLEYRYMNKKKTMRVWGTVLIALGLVFFIKNTMGIKIFEHINWKYIWPLILIAVGINLILIPKNRSTEDK